MNRLLRILVTACGLFLVAAPGLAQPGTADAASESAFTLSSSEVFTTRDSPSFSLTFRHLTQLDFRVYRVRDPFKFFAGLRDPHQLGSEERPVAQERSWIERIAAWKAGQRRHIRTFVRDQVSREYRSTRRASTDKQEIARRLVLNETSFARVPLLNPDQLVASWRELLPDRRDPEYRRVPLEVKQQPGVYLVEAVSNLLRAYTVVIVSDTGLVTKTAPGQLLMFAADRFSGEPKPGCDVQVLMNQESVGRGQTGDDGVVTMSLPSLKAEDVVGVARCGEEVAATDPGGWFASESARQLLGYIYTDKPIYRPGHTVHLKAVLRWRERDAVLPFDRPTAEISVTDANDKVVFRQSLKTDAFGSFMAEFPVPPTAGLGFYSIRVASGDEQASGGFEVQEYRRPEFEVVVTPTARFVVQGSEAVASVQARYYFGQPVANARVRYVVNQQAYYSPLRWTDGSDEEGGNQYWYGDDQKIAGELRLDAQGRGEIRVALPVDENGRDFSARVEAQVTDASSREVSGHTVVHATYGPFLVAAQVSGYVFRPAQSVQVSLRAVDYAGAPRPDVPIRVVLERIRYPQGRYSDPEAAPVTQPSITTTAADGSGTATVTLPAEAGTYRVRAAATADDREIKSDAWIYVAGHDDGRSTDEDRYLELTADKRAYAPGDTARLLIRGETVSGPVLVTKEGQSVTWHRVLRPDGAIEVPIEAGDIGDIYVNIAFMRDGRLNQAERRLPVPATERSLQITLTADRATAKPQEPGVFSVRVTDSSGTPVSAQVSLGVIDEAVYAIRPDSTPDPVRFFYRREYTRVGTTFSRDYYFVGYSGSERLQLAARRRRPFTLADFKGDKQVQPQVRKDFPDAIYWIGDLVTDAEGQAKVSLKYPDALTTWRLTARAVTRDTRAGASIARTTTTKDLIVRVITPRFLTEGDEVVVPTIVHNYLESAKDTSVTFAARGLEPQAAPGTSAASATSGSIEKSGERRDDWRLRAATVGSAVVTASARTDADTDAVELTLPVLPYGLRREVGSSGAIRAAGEQTSAVTIPAASNPASRTVSVSLAPSMAGSLLGALDYLTSFPYGCTEQTLSSFLPNVMVTRALTQLKLAPTERLSALDRQVADGLKRLGDFQHDDGGWGWWKTDENHPFMTAYALYGLTEAKRAGYRVEEYRLHSAARALAAMYAEYPRAEPDLKAYIAYVLRRALPDGDAIGYPSSAGNQGEGRSYRHGDARGELWDARARMSAYGRALLLLLLDEARDPRGNELAQALTSEAQSAGELTWWAVDHDPLLADFADTSVETTATALQALARRDPSSPLLDRGVRWLMANRRGGYWSTTKQTAIALYGLLEVLQARNESAEPFSVDVHVNGALAGTGSFTTASLTAPDPVVMSVEGREGANDIRLVKKGGGTLYWSARATYYDTQGAAARSGSRQLAITRKYARLAPVRVQDRIVYREEPFDGRMHPGDVLTIRLTIAGAKDWKYLMVEDPLPAGVEAVQDTTAYPMERADRWRWWWGSQVEYRDNRTVFFQERFDEGRSEFVYLVKAISSGQFRAAPAQVAPMYVPDVNASSEPQSIVVAVAGEPQR